jgi:hypothetical protein
MRPDASFPPSDESRFLKISVTDPSRGNQPEVHVFDLSAAPERVTRDTPLALKWLHVLKYGHLYAEGEIPPALAEDDNLRRAIERYRQVLADPEVVEAARKADEREARRRRRRAGGGRWN